MAKTAKNGFNKTGVNWAVLKTASLSDDVRPVICQAAPGFAQGCQKLDPFCEVGCTNLAPL